MYLEFYGLSEKPFTQTPDPRFLYWNDAYRESLASLRYGILERKGFIAMVGEAGTGKTTLLRKLLDELGDEVVSVFLFNPNASFEEILEYTLSELGISSPSSKKLAMLQQLNEFLLAAFAEGRNTILLIDEAQDLDIDVLESLRLLSNLETAQDKILQIVLCGQPELADRLADPRIRQLKQRIAVRCRLDPLTRDELPLFLEARLAVAGGDGSLFLPETHDAIWQYSEGIPRLINTVCDNALLVGYALGRKTIDREVLQEVIIDLQKIDPREPIAPPPAPELITDIPPPSAETGTPAAPSPVGSPNEPKSPAPGPVPGISPAAESSPAIPVAPTQNGANPRAVAALLAVGLLLFAAVALFGNRTPAPVSHPLPTAPGNPAAAAAKAADPADRAGGVPAASEPNNPTSRLVPVPPEAPAPSPAPVPSATPVTTATPAPTTMPAPTSATMPATTSSGADLPRARLPSSASVPPVLSSQAWPTKKALSPTSAAPAPQEPTTMGTTTQAQVPELGTASPAKADRPRSTAAEGSLPRLVTVRPGDTLAEIALRVYGRQTYTLLDLLGAVNPEIEDPSRIIAGAVLLFPSLEAQTRIVTADGGELQVIALTTPSLRRALAAQNQLQSQMDRTVEIRTLSLQDGPDLYRVFLRAFTSPDEASRAADRLGPVLRK